MQYAIEQRLRLIDFLLFQYGKVNRNALIDYFGTGHATATRDFAEYKKLYPGNIIFDEQSKMYLKSPNFERAYP